MVAIKIQITPSWTKITLAERGTAICKEVLFPHLFPKQPSQTKEASTFTAHAKQANQRDEKQEKVSGKHRYDGRFTGPWPGRAARLFLGDPCRADLGMDQPRTSELFGMDSSPARNLVSKTIFSGFRLIWRKGGKRRT